MRAGWSAVFGLLFAMTCYLLFVPLGLFAAEGPPRQPWFPTAPPLPKPTGAVIRAATVAELVKAAQDVKPGGTILVADGHYPLPRPIDLHADNISLRSESGQRDKVVIDGNGELGVKILARHLFEASETIWGGNSRVFPDCVSLAQFTPGRLFQ